MKRAVNLILVAAIICALAPTATMAGTRSIKLDPVAVTPVDASGMAQIKTQAVVERFYVFVAADLKDGSKIVVAIERIQPGSEETWIDVAQTEIRLGAAVVDLNSAGQVVSPAFPASGIIGVRVMYRGKAFLEGSFR